MSAIVFPGLDGRIAIVVRGSGNEADWKPLYQPIAFSGESAASFADRLMTFAADVRRVAAELECAK